MKLFGTDGVRGIANTELTPEIAFGLGRAGTHVLTKKKKHAPKIILGMDTRLSGKMLENALTAGMCSMGATVYCAGVIPTPGIAYLVRKYNLDAGVVISASHNSFEDNGIKFFNEDGYKLPDTLESDIESVLENDLNDLPRPFGKYIGTVINCDNCIDDYIDFLESSLGGLKLDGLRIAIDTANGAAYKIAPILFERLGAEVSAIHNEPNGLNINSNCGSTHMESLMDFVKANRLDLGIAFDGDGDRCLLVDENGDLLQGDEILSILSNKMKAAGNLKKDTLVATVMSNLGLFLMGEQRGIKIEKTGVGDRYVLERMLEGGFNLGGEQSGHVILLDFNTTGDGILTSLQIAAIMKETSKKLSELNTYMKIMPQVIVNAKVDNRKKMTYLSNPQIKSEIDALEKKFDSAGRVLIRASGTESVVRVMIEGNDKEELSKEANRLAQIIERELQ